MRKRKFKVIEYQNCEDEVFNGNAHKKFVKRNRGLKLILLVLIILAIGLGFFASKNVIKTNNKIVDPELARAMSYDRVLPGDENTNSDCVNFDAFFLRDLDGDGYAEGVRGTCREIGKTDTLYMELKVVKDGYFKDGKITINGQNFYFSTTIPKDEQVAENAISDDTRQILLNTINDGTQKLLTGAVRAGDDYNYYKAGAIGKDSDGYSNVSTVVLTGTHVASDGTETPVEKIVNFDVDWYGTATASIPYYTYAYTKNLSQTKEIMDAIDEENNEITLEFDIYTAELENRLNLKKSVLYGVIPQLGESDPINVEITGTNVTYTYDSDTREYVAQIESETDENGLIIKNAYSDSYRQSRYAKFHILVTYPLDAYYAMASTSFEYRLPVNAYFEAFNNPNNEFTNPYISNTVSNAAVIEFKQILPVGREANFDVKIGDYISNPSWRYVVSKLKPLKIFNGISESEQNDTYSVRWYAYTGTEGKFTGITLKEGIENDEKTFDKFIEVSGNYTSMSDFTKYISIGFSDPVSMLGEDGWIKVYDDETDELLITFDKTNWSRYYSTNQYKYEIPVRSVRVETSATNVDSNLTIYHTKEIDDEYIVENFTKEEFANFRYIRTRLEGYTENLLFKTLTATANYEAPLSVAKVAISKSAITTQETEKNEIISIKTECNNSSNEAYWKDGVFLVKLPSEIIDAGINSITVDNQDVKIENYEIYEEEGNYFIKIITSNDVPTTYTIMIDTKLTPDPRISTVSEKVELWARNDVNENYYYYGEDVYDTNGDGNISELVNKYSASLMLVSPSALLTNQTAYDYNKDGSIVVAPQTAYVEKEQREAKINIQIKNNYASTISDIEILGRIPFEGNTYAIAKGDLGSTYTTFMKAEGIHVPDDIEDICNVYYSYNESPTKELNDESNGWTEDPEDFSKVKSYLIVLKDYRMAKDEVKNFWYTVNLPQGIDYNEISYSHYGVYFSLDTENGKYRTQTEPNKLGLMIAKQYNLELTKFQKDKTKKIQGAAYSIQEEGKEDAITKFTNADGLLIFENILLDRVYTVREIISPSEYELNSDIFKFIAYEENGDIVIEKLEGNVSKFEVVKNDDEDAKVIVNVEDEVKANLKITKFELGTDTKLKNGRYKLTGKNYEDGITVITDSNGEATLTGLSLEEEYTLEEIKAPKGYYLNNEVIKFSVHNNDGNYVLNKASGVTKSEVVTTEDEIPLVSFEIEDEKIPTYDLLINKVVKGEMTPIAGVKFRLYYAKEFLGTYESDENGKILLEGLYQYVESKNLEQNYTLKEIYTPDGFAKVKDITFSVEEVDGKLILQTDATSVTEQYSEERTVTITIEDPKSFKLTKIDGETAEVLPGTKFAIYNISNGKVTTAYDAKGNIVGTPMTIDGKEYYILETDERGEISANLGEGLYKAVEIKACDEKYDISDNTYYFGIGASIKGTGNDCEEILYMNVIKGNSSSKINDVCKSSDGGYLLAGYFEGNIIIGDKTLTSKGSYAGLVLKYNFENNLEWYSIVDGTGYDKLYSVEELSDGGYIVGGDLDSSSITFPADETKDGKEINFGRNMGAGIIKYDSIGKVEWVQTIGAGSDEYVFAIKETSDEGILVAGTKKSSNIDFGNNVILSGTGGFVVKYDSDGKALWAKHTNDIIYAINKIEDNYIVGGKGVLKEFDCDGNEIFDKNITGTINAIKSRKSGGYVIVGKSLNGSNSVCAYNENGEIDFTITNSDEATGVLETFDGRYIVTYSNGTLIIYNDEGEIELSKVIGTSITAIDELAFSGIITAGDLNGTYNYENNIITTTSQSIFFTILSGGGNVPEQSEILAENYRKEFKITTDIEEIDGVKGGTISGEDERPYEVVKYGDSSLNEIKMIPNDEYEIISITVNGESYTFEKLDDGSYSMPQFDNVTENKHIVVKFARSSNKLTINKTDSVTGEVISGVKFQIDQLEERENPNVDLTGLTGNSSEYKYPIKSSEVSGIVGDFVANGMEIATVDKSNEANNAVGNIVNNGIYYFIEQGGKYIPTNGNTYQLTQGSSGKHSTIAYSYVPIDLTNVSGNFAVVVNARVSSESSYDYGYAKITENTDPVNWDSSNDYFMNISGTVSDSDYTSQSLQGGKIYYLHLGYRKDGSNSNEEDQVVINSINVYSAIVQTYNFIENDGKYESNNQGVGSSIAYSYVPIDLRDKEGDFAVVVDATVSSQSGYDYGFANITTTTNRGNSNNFLNISGEKSIEAYKVIEGGQLYYLHLGYYKNNSTNSGDDKFTINNIKVYNAETRKYDFINNGGVYESTNQGMSSTYSRSYIPIDLTGYTGKYKLIVNAEISSESSDYGYLTTSTSTSQTVNNYFARISGNIVAKDYTKIIEGGQLYYLHMAYYKNSTIDSGEDTFKINSVRLELSDQDLYHTTATSDGLGQAISQIPYGLYQISEVETPDGYEKMNPITYRMESGKDNVVNIENIPFGKVIAHHYLKDAEGNYTTIKLADDEILTGSESESYETFPKVDIDGYMLETIDGEQIIPNNRKGNYISGEVIEVNYYYQLKESKLIVHHYIEGSNVSVPLLDGTNAEDENYSGNLGSRYETSAVSNDILAERYELVSIPLNATGVYGENTIEVIYYYKEIERSLSIQKYDEDNTTVLPGVKYKLVKDGDIQESVYVTNSSGQINITIPYGSYELVELEAVEGYDLPEESIQININRNFEDNSIINVTNEKTRGTIIVHHYIEGTADKVPTTTGVAEDEITVGILGEMWASQPAQNRLSAYEVVSEPEITSGTIKEGTLEITYYYRPKVTSVLVHHYVEGTEERLSEDVLIDGRVFDLYTTNEATDIDSKWQVAVVPENKNGEMTEEQIVVTYYYRKKPARVIVHHYEEGTINKLSEDVVYEGRVDDEYETEAATDIPIKYELVGNPENKSGNMTEDEIHVIYYYRVKDTKLIVRYLEKYTDKILADEEEQRGKVDEEYITDSKLIDGYTLVEHSGNEKGRLTIEPIVVTYYYLYNTKATVQYIDKNTGEILDARTDEGLEGDEFSTESKDFENYVLIEEPEEKVVNMTKEEIVLKYYYVHVSAGVIEKHIDKITGEVLYNEVHEGNEGDDYDIKSKENDEGFEKYDLVEEELPENAKGKMTIDPIEVKYYYIHRAKVIAKYIDKATGRSLADEEEQNGYEGVEYTTDRKNFDDYILLEVPKNADGNMTKEDIEVIYYYAHTSAGVVEKHIDILTGKEIINDNRITGYEGIPYETREKEFDRYELVKEMYPENANGVMKIEEIVVRYYYKRKSSIIIKHIDKLTGEEITESEERKGYEGDEYTTEEKEINGYDLVEEPDNKDGKIGPDPTEIIYYYLRPAMVVVNHYELETMEKLADEEVIKGHDGNEYKTNSKVFDYYKLISEPENKNGNMRVRVIKLSKATEEELEEVRRVKEYYEKSDIKSEHDENSDEELESEQVVEDVNKEAGIIQDDKEVSKKDGKVVEKDFIDDIIFVDYYYRKKVFNLSIDKTVTEIVDNGAVISVNNNVGKIEINKNKVAKSDIFVRYKITVKNNSELTGRCTIEENIPNGMIMLQSDNPDWYVVDNKAIINTENIEPGKSKSYNVILRWVASGDNVGMKENIANIIETENEAKFEESDDRDNQDYADIVISIDTGITDNDYIILNILTVLALMILAIRLSRLKKYYDM